MVDRNKINIYQRDRKIQIDEGEEKEREILI